ncbi:MAG: efflux RND transporter periplasmic adaptor subunit [Alphaproteobacteria bacterium]|nr:efflux RND transporter periplasmic adaptor subunit [Alphaproteobacteria bacterium]
MFRAFLLIFMIVALSPAHAYEKAQTVIITQVKEGVLNPSIAGVGTFSPYNDVILKSETAGRIHAVHFSDGEFAKPDQTLFTIHNEEQQANVKKAESALQKNINILKRKEELATRKFASLQDLEAAETDVKSSEADLILAKEKLEKTKIRAPFDGALSERQVGKGSYVTEGDALVRIQDITPIRLKFTIPQKEIPLIKVGDKVLATTDVYPEVIFAGTVEAIEPAVDESSRSVMIFATFPNEDKKLIPGLYACAELKTTLNTKNSLFVPEQALVIRPTGNYVYKQSGNKAILTKVTLGQRTADQAEILSGLVRGDSIVLEGQDKIQDGSVITVAPKS